MNVRGWIAGAALIALASSQAVSAQTSPRPSSNSKPTTSVAPKTAPAPAPAPAAQNALPNNATLLIMIRSSLSALNQANGTNNYTVLHQMGSPAFQRTNTPPTLSQAFAPFRERRISLNPALLLPPKLLKPVGIENGQLAIVGYFETQPLRIVFDLRFDNVQGGWQLAAINVNMPAVQQQAQQPAPAPTQAPRKKPR